MSLADVVGMGHGNPTNFRSAANPGILIEGIEDPTTTLRLEVGNLIDLIRDPSESFEIQNRRIGWDLLTEDQRNLQRENLQGRRLRYNEEQKKQLTEKQVSRILVLASNLLSPVQEMVVNPRLNAAAAYKKWALADSSSLCLTSTIQLNQKCHFKVIRHSQPPPGVLGVQEEVGDRRFFHTGFHDSIAKFPGYKAFNLLAGYKAIDKLFNGTSDDLCPPRKPPWDKDEAANYMYLLLKFYFPANLSGKDHSPYVKIIKKVLGQMVDKRCGPRPRPQVLGSVERMNDFKALLNTELANASSSDGTTVGGVNVEKYYWNDQLHELFTTQIESYNEMILYVNSPFPKKIEGSYFPKKIKGSSWNDISSLYYREIHGPARAAAAAQAAAAQAAAAQAAAADAAAKAAADAAAKAAADAAAVKAAAKAAADAARDKAERAKEKEEKAQPKVKKNMDSWWAPLFGGSQGGSG